MIQWGITLIPPGLSFTSSIQQFLHWKVIQQQQQKASPYSKSNVSKFIDLQISKFQSLLFSKCDLKRPVKDGIDSVYIANIVNILSMAQSISESHTKNQTENRQGSRLEPATFESAAQ